VNKKSKNSMTLLIFVCALAGILFGVLAKLMLGKYGIDIPFITSEESRRIVGFMCTGLSASFFYLAYLAYKLGNKAKGENQ